MKRFGESEHYLLSLAQSGTSGRSYEIVPCGSSFPLVGARVGGTLGRVVFPARRIFSDRAASLSLTPTPAHPKCPSGPTPRTHPSKPEA